VVGGGVVQAECGWAARRREAAAVSRAPAAGAGGAARGQVALELLGADVQTVSQLADRRLLLLHTPHAHAGSLEQAAYTANRRRRKRAKRGSALLLLLQRWTKPSLEVASATLVRFTSGAALLGFEMFFTLKRTCICSRKRTVFHNVAVKSERP